MADRRPIPLRADPCALRSATVSALARAIIVKAHARLGNRRDEAGIMRSRFPDDPAAMLMPRAASSPTITTTASAVVQTVVADIIAATGAVGAGARLLQSGLLLSFEDGVGMVSVPGIAISANKAAFIEEGAPMVKTKFKVEQDDGPHPEDRWYAWLNGEWVLVPPDKIVPDYAPDGTPYLFMMAGTIQCFVRPRGGL
jgi:hypothetical protein